MYTARRTPPPLERYELARYVCSGEYTQDLNATYPPLTDSSGPQKSDLRVTKSIASHDPSCTPASTSRKSNANTNNMIVQQMRRLSVATLFKKYHNSDPSDDLDDVTPGQGDEGGPIEQDGDNDYDLDDFDRIDDISLHSNISSGNLSAHGVGVINRSLHGPGTSSQHGNSIRRNYSTNRVSGLESPGSTHGTRISPNTSTNNSNNNNNSVSSNSMSGNTNSPSRHGTSNRGSARIGMYITCLYTYTHTIHMSISLHNLIISLIHSLHIYAYTPILYTYTAKPALPAKNIIDKLDDDNEYIIMPYIHDKSFIARRKDNSGELTGIY